MRSKFHCDPLCRAIQTSIPSVNTDDFNIARLLQATLSAVGISNSPGDGICDGQTIPPPNNPQDTAPRSFVLPILVALLLVSETPSDSLWNTEAVNKARQAMEVAKSKKGGATRAAKRQKASKDGYGDQEAVAGPSGSAPFDPIHRSNVYETASQVTPPQTPHTRSPDQKSGQVASMAAIPTPSSGKKSSATASTTLPHSATSVSSSPETKTLPPIEPQALRIQPGPDFDDDLLTPDWFNNVTITTYCPATIPLPSGSVITVTQYVSEGALWTAYQGSLFMPGKGNYSSPVIIKVCDYTHTPDRLGSDECGDR